MAHIKKFRSAFRQTKAVGVLKEIIESQCLNNEAMMPPLRSLAQRCGVSQTTTLLALQHLCDDGLLSRIPNRGYQIVPVPAAGTLIRWPDIVRETPPGGADRIMQALSKDIADRTFPPGSDLPSQKILRHRFGISHRTMRLALTGLENQNLITRYGRRIVVSINAPRLSSSSLVFIVHRYMNFALVGGLVYGRDLWRTFEDECLQRGISLAVRTDQLEPLNTRKTDAPSFKMRLHHVIKPENVLGYVIWSVAFDARQLVSLVQNLRKTGRPVTVLDDTFTIMWPKTFQDDTLVRLVQIGNPQNLGFHLGLHLAELGHNALSFFGYQRYDFHVRGRIEGIRKAFRHRDQKLSITMVPVPDIDDEEQQAELTRILDAELRTGHSTVWVGFNDAIALHCIDFLNGRNRRVPADMSVAGFDNLLESFINDLTTVSFDASAAVPSILNHQMGIPDPLHRENVHLIEAKRICRGSTGRVPRR